MQSQLMLQQLVLQVHLGCSEKERETLQSVDVEITLHFDVLPEACISDQLEETVCYAGLVDLMQATCQAREFNLIEHLGYTLYQAIKEKFSDTSLTLLVKKNPPINHLQQASFVISDEK